MKTIINITKRDIIISISLIIIGMFLGWLIFSGPSVTQNGKQDTEQVSASEKSTIWTCSMHPQIKQGKSGQCPLCGMDLIPLEDDSEEDSPIHIQMSESAMRIAEIQTTKVERTVPFKEVYFSGKVKADERLIISQTAHIPGRIEKLYVSFTGERVRKGQKLVSIYSPELITAQEELFEALKHSDSYPALLKSARKKLKLWKLTDQQVESIEKSGEAQTEFDILADYSGIVTKRMVTLGDYVKEGEVLFHITNLNHIWVMFDAYESDIPWVKLRDKIQFTIRSIPGRTFTGTVTFIDPVINPKTRVAYIRTELNNPKNLLKPGMFVSGILKTTLQDAENALVIPKSAILWTGKRSVVYIKDPDKDKPTFEYREIVLGEDAGNYYIVKEGLKEGDEIATHGVFKIDAAAQLQGKASMMNPQGGKVSTGHQHGEMDMGKMKMTEKKEIKPAEDIDPEFKKQLAYAYQSYLDMKEAFVASDAAKVKETSSKVKTMLKKVDMKLVKGDNHMKWMKQLNTLNKSLDEISGSDDIGKQREHFAMFSETLYNSIKLFGVAKGEIYYQYCPMAMSNKGAYWLSNIKQIRNPYFGEKMMKCGTTKETLR